MSRKKTDKRLNLGNKSYIQIIPLKRTEHWSVHDQVVNEYLHTSRSVDKYIVVHSKDVPECVEEVNKAALSLLQGYDTVHKIHESKIAVLKSRITIFEASTDSAIVGERVRSSIDELKESAERLENETQIKINENAIKEFRKNSEKLQSCIKKYSQFLDESIGEYNRENLNQSKDDIEIQVIDV